MSVTLVRTLRSLALIAAATTGLHAQNRDHFPKATPESEGLSSASLAAISDQMESWVDEGRVVGAEVLIVKNRRTVFHDMVGWKDREKEIAWEPNTICRIRSMTKPFVGTAVLMLVDEGRLSVSDPVSQYISAFDNERSRDITIEQVLTHTAGFTQPGYPAALQSYGSLREAVDAVGNAGPPNDPGTKWIYSDAGSATLGALIAEVSGMPAEEFIRLRIVEPLGLTSTLMNLSDDSPLRPRVSSTYRSTPSGSFFKYWDSTGPQVMKFFRASGGIYSTTTDYARFLAFWMDGGTTGTTQLLSPELVESALQVDPLSQDVHPYGYQWQIFEQSDPSNPSSMFMFGHGGSDGTIAWAIPSEDLIVVYFTQSRGGNTRDEIGRVVEKAFGADWFE
ncbi:MAG: beta-lactamase family protein [Gemmatimonadota bacterium]|nr:MAG: beta-lactamase family protein [Gemmatimonadota bacterium]